MYTESCISPFLRIQQTSPETSGEVCSLSSRLNYFTSAPSAPKVYSLPLMVSVSLLAILPPSFR